MKEFPAVLICWIFVRWVANCRILLQTLLSWHVDLSENRVSSRRKTPNLSRRIVLRLAQSCLPQKKTRGEVNHKNIGLTHFKLAEFMVSYCNWRISCALLRQTMAYQSFKGGLDHHSSYLAADAFSGHGWRVSRRSIGIAMPFWWIPFHVFELMAPNNYFHSNTWLSYETDYHFGHPILIH